MPNYTVDFGSWSVKAEDEEEARKIACKMLEDGETPPIDQILEQD